MKFWQQALLISLSSLALGSFYLTPTVWDLTQSQANSLSDMSRSVLKRLNKPLELELYSPNLELGAQLNLLLERIVDVYPETQFRAFNRSLSPSDELPRPAAHSLRIHYGEMIRTITIDEAFTEERLADALYALVQDDKHWILFLDGHQELDPNEVGSAGLSQWAEELDRMGLKNTRINLQTSGIQNLPDKGRLLVLANPKTPPLFHELLSILAFIERGGNILWLIDSKAGYEAWQPLAQTLGFKLVSQGAAWSHQAPFDTLPATWALVQDYPRHPLFEGLRAATIFPNAQALQIDANTRWQARPLLSSQAANRLQTLALEFQPTQARHDQSQKIVVIANSHFLSNQYLKRYGNRLLAKGLANWLSLAEPLPLSPNSAIEDIELIHTPALKHLHKWGFGVCMPGLFLVLAIRQSRQRHGMT